MVLLATTLQEATGASVILDTQVLTAVTTLTSALNPCLARMVLPAATQLEVIHASAALGTQDPTAAVSIKICVC